MDGEQQSITIKKVSDNNYQFNHNISLYGGTKGEFQNIFVSGSEDYKNFLDNFGGLSPENLPGLKTVPQGMNHEANKKNIEAYVAGLLFQRVQENKGLYTKVTYEEI